MANESKTWLDKIETKKDEIKAKAKESETNSLASSVDVEEEWADLEKQRDIAFKIMYFFIVFIIATFSLLYAYFRMTQNSEREEAQRKGVKGQANRGQQPNFFDFIAGQMDEETYVVNPYARKHATQVAGQFSSASTPFANLASTSFIKAQQIANKAKNTKKSDPSNVPEHRQN